MLTMTAPASSSCRRGQPWCRTSVILNVVQPRRRRVPRARSARVPSFGIRSWRRSSAGWPSRNKPAAGGPHGRRTRGPCVMGAGVATNPHFPRVEAAVPVKACTSSLGGSGFGTSLAALADSLSGPSQALLPAVPCRVAGEYRYPASFSFRGSAARKRRSRWTVRKVGAALAFALPHASSSLALPSLPRRSSSRMSAASAPAAA